jgi:hypothetical protein
MEFPVLLVQQHAEPEGLVCRLHISESGQRRQRVDRTDVTNLIKRAYFIRYSLWTANVDLLAAL